MIGRQKIFAIVSPLIYFLLFIVFVYFLITDIAWNCDFQNPCIRFCSEDIEKISSHKLFSEFAKSGIADYQHRFNRKENLNNFVANNFEDINGKNVYRVFRGEPKCEIKIVQNPKDPEYYYYSVRSY